MGKRKEPTGPEPKNSDPRTGNVLFRPSIITCQELSLPLLYLIRSLDEQHPASDPEIRSCNLRQIDTGGHFLAFAVLAVPVPVYIFIAGGIDIGGAQ